MSNPSANADGVDRILQNHAVDAVMKARRNLDRWGLQDPLTLVAAMAEELGECSQAVLQALHEGGNWHRATEEAADLAPLCLQLIASVDRVPRAGNLPGPPHAPAAVWRAVPWNFYRETLLGLAEELAAEVTARFNGDMNRTVEAQLDTLLNSVSTSLTNRPDVTATIIRETVRGLCATRKEKELARRIGLIVSNEWEGEPEGVCPGCGEPVEQDCRKCPACGLCEGEDQEASG